MHSQKILKAKLTLYKQNENVLYWFMAKKKSKNAFNEKQKNILAVALTILMFAIAGYLLMVYNFL
jgi:ribosomal protein L39E